MLDVLEAMLVGLNWAILAYFLVVNGFLLLLLLMAAIDLRSQRLDVWQEGRWRLLGSDVAPVISILAPAHNEERTVTESGYPFVSNNAPRDGLIGICARHSA